MKLFRRIVCSWIIISLVGIMSPMAVHAQTAPRPDDRDQYVADVTSRAALAEDLAARRAEAEYRRQTIEESIRRLRQETPPPGTDHQAWNQQRESRIAWLEDYMHRNEQALERYESNLSSVQSSLESDRQYIMSTRDEELRQALGTFIGVAGLAGGIPTQPRPSVGTLQASVGRSTMGMQPTGSPDAALSAARAQQAGLTAQASSLQAPTRAQWVTEVGANGNVQLRSGSTVHDLGVKAQVRSADGSMIRNDAAFRKASYYSQIYTTRSNIDHSIQSLRHQRASTTNARAQRSIDNQIRQLETQRNDLNKDLARHDADRPGAGTRMANLAASAAKWAVFSAGITVTTRAFQELHANNWDMSRVDWGNVVAPLKTAEFWGGTGGAFLGSMALSSIVPGGAFMRTFAAIGGAAIGWQAGSGNLMHTDWLELGVSTLGATLGSLLGSFLGPVGTMLGGMAGHYAATWLLGRVRNWLSSGFIAYDRSDRYEYESDYTAAPHVYQPSRDSYGSPDQDDRDMNHLDPVALQNRLMELQVQMQAAMEAPSSPAQMQYLDGLRREYGQVQRSLSDLRHAAGPTHFGSY